MATAGHIYRDTWYSGQRCHCCNLTDADHAARQAAYADQRAHDVTWMTAAEREELNAR